jgi:hypothetical protein
LLVGDHQDLLADEIVALVAVTAIGVPVVGGVIWTSIADAVNSNIAQIAEAYSVERIFVE